MPAPKKFNKLRAEVVGSALDSAEPVAPTPAAQLEVESAAFLEPDPVSSTGGCCKAWASTLLVTGLSAGAFVTAVVLAAAAYLREDVSGALATPWAPLPPDGAELFRIGWGSCGHQNKSQDYWNTLVKAGLDLLVLAGDNVYGDCRHARCKELRAAYDGLALSAPFQRAKQHVPMLATWDDHDFGQGDGDGSNPHKQVAKDMFLDFYHVSADSVLRQRDGLYYARTWGPLGRRVQVIMLDTRWFRSRFLSTDELGHPYKERYMPDASALSKTMLGEEQWAWLRDRLFEPADLRLLVSSIQLVPNGHGWECWRMLPHERARFYSLLEEAAPVGGGTPVVLSGDRHVGGLYVEPPGGEAGSQGVAEATASSWTHSVVGSCPVGDASCDEPGPQRLGPLVRSNHFGTVEVDWAARAVRIVLRHAESGRSGADAGDAIQNMTLSLRPAGPGNMSSDRSRGSGTGAL